MSVVNIFDIKRFAIHDGPGIRTTVFMKGCPLRCWWCHNPESQSPESVVIETERKLNGKTLKVEKRYGSTMNTDELIEVIKRDRHFYEESKGGVTFSGGEPLMQGNALQDLLNLSRINGIHTTIDTSGFAKKELVEQVAKITDLFLFDLKHMDPELHRQYTGVDNKLILSNADWLLRNGSRVIFRIPVIPGINTSAEELERFTGFIEERIERLKEIHLLPYHRIAENKYLKLRMTHQMKDVAEPGAELLEQIKQRFESSGVKVLIGG